MTPPFHPSPQARGWTLDGSKGCDVSTLVLDPEAGGKKRGTVGRRASSPIFPLCTLAREREKGLGQAEGDPGGGQSFGAQTLVLLVTWVSGMKLPPGCPRLLGHRPLNNCPSPEGSARGSPAAVWPPGGKQSDLPWVQGDPKAKARGQAAQGPHGGQGHLMTRGQREPGQQWQHSRLAAACRGGGGQPDTWWKVDQGHHPAASCYQHMPKDQPGATGSHKPHPTSCTKIPS